MSLNRMLQVLLPQPGDDLRSWASSLVAQLQFLLQQQANDTQMLSSAPATAPLYQSDGNTLVITDVGEYKLANGTVIVDANGLHVKDLVGFDVINGPTIRIDTAHLVDNAITTSKLATGSVTADKFFGNLEPIEVVAALPNPVGYVGPPVVLLSSDGKLYRYTAGAWTAAVPTVDLTGQITTTQITDGAITTPKLVAGAVTTEKITAGAVTANELAANSVIAAKIDAGAVTAAKLAAASVVAGKLAANAIVASDGVIANAAIVDAQIATLNASKINAGDIAAARMSTNIVTALEGKFATLSALAASLGVVQIQTGGALLTQGVTTYTSGTGLWTGENAGVYKFRIGNPSGTRLDWDGNSLVIYDQANQPVFISGNFSGNGAPLTVRFRWLFYSDAWGFTATNAALSADPNYLTMTYTALDSVLRTPAVNFSGARFYKVRMRAMRVSGSAPWQGTLFYSTTTHGEGANNKSIPNISITNGVWYTFEWDMSTVSDWNGPDNVTQLRFDLTENTGAQLDIWRIQYVIVGADGVGHQIGNDNIASFIATGAVTGTYIADATIGTAKIIDANITTAKIADAAIQNAKIGDLQVGTIKIANAAVTQHFATFTSSPRITTATETTVATLSGITTASGDQLLLMYTQVADNNLTAATSLILRVYRDSTLIESHTTGLGASRRELYTLHLSHGPGAGTFTYTVKIQTTGIVDVSMDSSGDFSMVIFKK